LLFAQNPFFVFNGDKSIHVAREHALPTASARPRRIALSPDGTIYYTDFAPGYLGHFDPTSGKLLIKWASSGGTDSEPYGSAIHAHAPLLK
jgi:virginiamycin B lyase